MYRFEKNDRYTCLDLMLPGEYRYGGKQPEIYIPQMARMRDVRQHSRFPSRVSCWYLLFFVERGMTEMIANDRVFPLEEGDIFAVLPGMSAKYNIRVEPWEYTWVMFDGHAVSDIFRAAGIDNNCLVPEVKCNGTIHDTLDELENAYRCDACSRFLPVTSAWRIIDHISQKQPGIESVTYPKDLAEQAKLLMDRHFTDLLAVDDIADRLNVSRSTLFRHFRAAFGLSPKQYLNEIRMSHVLELLLNSEMTMKEIAYACGFHDDQHLNHTFKHRFGKPPLKWKRSAT